MIFNFLSLQNEEKTYFIKAFLRITWVNVVKCLAQALIHGRILEMLPLYKYQLHTYPLCPLGVKQNHCFRGISLTRIKGSGRQERTWNKNIRNEVRRDLIKFTCDSSFSSVLLPQGDKLKYQNWEMSLKYEKFVIKQKKIHSIGNKQRILVIFYKEFFQIKDITKIFKGDKQNSKKK